MTVVSESPNILRGEPNAVGTTAPTLAAVVTAASVLFNFILCFINTNIFSVSPGIVVSTEMTLIGLALGLIWYRTIALYAILLALTAYFLTVMLIRSEFDPKIIRDILIPIVFFFVGRELGSTRSADRLVTFLIVVAFAVAIFEWLTPKSFLHFFNVVGYYVARGTITGTNVESSFVLNSGFFNSARFESRTLLPFLGDHRVGGIFLEAPSVGNFGVTVFAWMLLQSRKRYWAFTAKSLAVATMIVLADARFGLYFCIVTPILFAATPYVRSRLLFTLPFLVIVALATYATANWEGVWDNRFFGRLLLAGHLLTTLDPWQVFGLLASDVAIGASFAMNAVTDSGYAYTLMKVGLFGIAGLWGLFIYAPVISRDAIQFRNFVALYYIVLLTISASVFSLKTAGLLWFLYGTLNNPRRLQTIDQIGELGIAEG
jgi:putative polymerase